MSINKCFSSDFPKVEQKIKRIIKKLEKYNLNYTFKKLEETIELVNIVDYTNYDNVPSFQFIPKVIENVPMDITIYEFEMEKLKIGDYKAIAILEHNAIIGNNENIIHVLDDSITIPEKYRTAKSICEHCNSNRTRNKTVLLQDKQGIIKQIGTTCVKEYTGIEANDIIKYYQEIHDYIIDNNNLNYNYSSWDKQIKYIATIDYLNACIDLIKTQGYKKDDTKIKAWENAKIGNINKENREIAQTVIDYFTNKNIEYSESFLGNTKTYLKSEYTKLNGFIAYAYESYKKEIEKDKKKAEIIAESNYVGNVGDKLQLELTYVKEICFDTYYGRKFIHLFKDNKGNQYKWNTTNILWDDKKDKPCNLESIVKIKGTVKAHDVYNGIKQTELTRCKVIG